MDGAVVVLIDDDADLRHALLQTLQLDGFDATGRDNAADGLALLDRAFYGVVICDIRMPGMDGMQFLEAALDIDPALPVIIITGHGDVPLAVRALKTGAYDFLEKPFAPSRLSEVAARAIEKRRLVLENRALRQGIDPGASLSEVLVGSSPCMQALRRRIEAVAATEVDVLIRGETGTGKEVVARAIHRLGSRRQGPFVAINCGAMPTDIIESELFGHEKGAYTGAAARRIGKFEHADGGTILLDEIESMPLDLQVKLLRVVEERAIVRLGANDPIPVDVRILAAAKEDIAAAAREGRFRPDLYYRLNVVAIELPPLRDHREDIPEIFFQLARQARARYRKDIPDLPSGLIPGLQARDWPGNVRELRNTADRFVLGMLGHDGPVEPKPTDLPGAMAAHERALLQAALARHGGRIRPVYEELGISRKSLYEKMKRHGL